MPPTSSADFDDQLGRSVRELNSLQEESKPSVLVIYSRRNVPGLDGVGQVVSPTQVIEDLRNDGFDV